MAKIFQTDKDGLFLLYPLEHQIMFQIKSPASCSRPISLGRDYLSSLDGVIHQGILYYTWIDLQHSPHFSSIQSTFPLFSGAPLSPDSPCGVRMISFSDTLLLFCAGREENAPACQLTLYYPLQPDIPSVVLYQQPTPFTWDIAVTDNRLLLCIFSGDKLSLLQADTTCTFSPCITAQEKEQSDAAAANEKVLKRLTILEQKLTEKERIIDSIQQQYQELMQVAESYQQEAQKWYQLYLHS